jgi:hypothetical protein
MLVERKHDYFPEAQICDATMGKYLFLCCLYKLNLSNKSKLGS